jgi:effector-binding domain-containing protein
MIDTPQVTRTAARPAAVIHLTIPRGEMMSAFGPAVQELMSALAEQGVAPAGPVFAHHLRMEPGTFDFELGVPVAGPVAEAGRVKAGELPAATVARTVFHGDYASLPGAWGEFDAWIRANGHTPAADLWEVYATNPDSDPDPAAWRTELNRPLAG